MGIEMPDKMEVPSSDPTSARAMFNLGRQQQEKLEQTRTRDYSAEEISQIKQFLADHEELTDKLVGFYGDKTMKLALDCPTMGNREYSDYVKDQEAKNDPQVSKFSESYRRGLILLADSPETKILGEDISLLMASKYDRYKNGTDLVGVARQQDVATGRSEEINFGLNTTRELYKLSANNDDRVEYLPSFVLAARRKPHSSGIATNAVVDLPLRLEADVILLASELIEGKDIAETDKFAELQRELKGRFMANLERTMERLDGALEDRGVGETVHSFYQAKKEAITKIESAIEPVRLS